jgi:hypothetical protein
VEWQTKRCITLGGTWQRKKEWTMLHIEEPHQNTANLGHYLAQTKAGRPLETE